MHKPGKLIVLDGLDGCGKSTQFQLLSQRMGQAGIPVLPISFPDYDHPSSALVKLYLNGEISPHAGDVNAYAASSFYAVDRYASYKRCWEQPYQQGTTILASRYVTSNAIHQMSKLPRQEWDDYLEWLSAYEYEKLELPRPDLVLFLDMPVSAAQKLLCDRYGGDETKKDIHESDVAYMERCRDAALYAAQQQGWQVIPCSRDAQPLTVEEIGDRVWKVVCEQTDVTVSSDSTGG